MRIKVLTPNICFPYLIHPILLPLDRASSLFLASVVKSSIVNLVPVIQSKNPFE
ncbi:hypothetical protein [Lunatibacter salilacus]|uniref:hypothetical protein n=1 Tax=Lunatibacter salilacus TaxID=2483804 RepID=UPI001F41E16E|nr:hypothetical protein [Lunatibacter salilacus]